MARDLFAELGQSRDLFDEIGIEKPQAPVKATPAPSPTQQIDRALATMQLQPGKNVGDTMTVPAGAIAPTPVDVQWDGRKWAYSPNAKPKPEKAPDQINLAPREEVAGSAPVFTPDRKEYQSTAGVDRVLQEPDTWGEISRKTGAKVLPLLKQSFAGLLQYSAENANDPGTINTMVGRVKLFDVPEYDAWLADQRKQGLVPGQALYADAAKDIAENTVNYGNEGLKKYVPMIADSVIQMAPAIATTFATKNPEIGAMMMGGQVAASQYGESRELGRTPQQASHDAVVMGVAESLGEKIPLGMLMRPGGKFLSNTLKVAGAEGVQEVMTQTIQTGYDKGVLHPEMTWGEAFEQIKDAGIVGAATGGSINVGVHGPAALYRTIKGSSPNVSDEAAVVGAQSITPEDVASPLDTADIATGRAAAPELTGQPTATVAPPKKPRILPVDTAPKARPFDKIVQITMGSESGGKRYGANGKLLESPAGAKGEMQVMDGTFTDPGFGVTPAKNNSPEERARVGRDYLAKMLERYGNDPSKMWAAYNAGPGALDNAIAAHGEDWLSHMPAETRKYVLKNIQKLGNFHPESGDLMPVGPEIDAAESPIDFARRVLGDNFLSANRGQEVAPAPAARDVSDPIVPTVVEAPEAPASETPANLPSAGMVVRVGKSEFPFDGDYQRASEAYRETIDHMNVGGSQTPPADIIDGSGNVVAHISYNGRVWRGGSKDWKAGDKPLYEPTESTSKVRIEPTSSGKGVAIFDATAEQLAAIQAALPEKASGMQRKDGATVYSAKYQDKIEQALAVDEGLSNATVGGVPLNEAAEQTRAAMKANEGEWRKFDAKAGSLDIPRAEMPQIKAEHRGAMVNFLNARGIAHREQTMPARALKPTQGEWSPAKVQQAREFTGGNRAILISQDNRIVDGHHQWLEAMERGEDIRVIRLMAPIKEVLAAAHAFPSSTRDTGREAPRGRDQSADDKRLEELRADNAEGRLDGEEMGELLDRTAKKKEHPQEGVKRGRLKSAIVNMTAADAEVVARKLGASNPKYGANGKEIWGQYVERILGQKSNAEIESALAKDAPPPESTISTETRADKSESPAKPPVSGVDQPSPNRLVTDERAAELRDRLKAKLNPNRLSSGVDPEILAIGAELAVYHIEKGARRFQAFAKAVAADLEMPLAGLRRYLRGWYNSARDIMEDSGESVAGMDSADEVAKSMRLFAEWNQDDSVPATQNESSEKSGQLDQSFADAFASGRSFASITEARAFAKETTGQEYKAGTPQAKQLDEAIEAGVVMAARKIAAKGNSASATYDALVDLYGRQPKLGVRTSTSIMQQAYSTPVPLAFLASQRAGIGQETTVYEPSAGNGALLIDARATYVTANELNPERAAQLKAIYRGATVTENDATEYLPEGKFDAVIENPPFGAVKDDTGESVVFEVDDQYSTREIDHAIAMKSLQAMKDGGKAVLIVGGLNKLITDSKKRADAYNGKAKREFYYKLYSQYNVTDHFTVDGALYERQGAGWPVDVIVIEGRGKSSLSLPAVKAPRQYGDWGTLKEALNGRTGQASAPVREPNGNAAVEAERPASTDDGNPVERGGSRTDGRERSDQAGQPEPVRAGSSTRQPAGVRVGAEREGVAGPAQDQRRSQPARRDQVEEGARQVAYSPRSKAGAMDTLVPVNMGSAIDDALESLEARVGNIDDFVSDRLGYKAAELGKYFGAEQVDAIALAIDNIERGAGFILGDQTGIGKGRVVAAVMRYAMRQGLNPVFVTEKPNLYRDMYRDMQDIGLPEMLGRDLNIVMTNSGEKVPLNEEGTEFLASAAPGKHTALLDRLAAAGSLADEGVDALFTTYAQMQTVAGKETNRQRVIETVARGGLVVMDESHNAGGTAGGFVAKGAPRNRARFARDLVKNAKGVLYSSATYAKRPDVMDLYSATDMRLAVDDLDKLAEAISKGGVPMQQVVAAMLARAGQYARRERSFDGITYDTPTVDVDIEKYGKISSILKGIQDFSENYVSDATKGLDEELRAEGKTTGVDNATGSAGAHSTNFTAIMHNVIDQMLLAFKADAAAQKAIEAIKRGEKPVITVANTLEAFLTQAAEDASKSPGSKFEVSFGDVLRRYLERSRIITVRKPFMAKGEKGERVRLTDDQIGEAGAEAFNDTMRLIDEAGLNELPGSPIDYIKAKIRDAGYEIGEITGRGLGLDYRDGTTYLMVRPQSERSIKGRIETIEGFNGGKIDSALLNRSGSTGLSLHASEKFKDQRPRRMIIAQAESNIDTHMQMLGRVHRTGQVTLPGYDQLVAGVPAEKRPAAVLAKKMASLNANTTAARDSALTSTDVLDFMNEYGDEVAARLMEDDPDIHRSLGEPLNEDEHGGYVKEGAARKVTGRIPLLPVEQQEELYQRIEDEYTTLLAQKDAAGENALEAKMFDLDAVPLESNEAVPAKKGSSSPFAEAVNVELMDVKSSTKPFTSDEVRAKVEKAEQPDFNEVIQRGQDFMRSSLDLMADDKARERTRERLAESLAAFRRVTARKIGDTIRLKTDNGNLYGVVTDIHRTKAKNPLAGWKMEVALANGNARQMTLSFRSLDTVGEPGPETDIIEKAEKIGDMPIMDAFDNMQNSLREERAIVTGNLLAGFDYVDGKGSIINFTTADGQVRQGIILPRGFNFVKHHASRPVPITDSSAIMQLLEQNSGLQLEGKGGTGRIAVSNYGNDFIFTTAKSKAAGGEFFGNSDLTRALGRDFVSNSSGMVARVGREQARAALDVLLEGGAKFELARGADDELKQQARDLMARAGGRESRAEVSREQFARQYLQHIDIRGRNGSAATTAETVREQGWKSGFGVNLLPVWMGGTPKNVIEDRFKPLAGDVVYLVPKEGYIDGDNGAKIKAGWKPKPNEVVTVERDGQDLYELFTKALGSEKRVEVKDAATDETVPPEQVRKDLKAQLDKMGLGDKVTLKVVDRLFNDPRIAGQYFNRTIRIATEANEANGYTLDHEAIHALKDMGLFKPEEWRALENAAKGETKLRGQIERAYPELNAEEQLEEVVAEMFASWRANDRSRSGFVRDAFRRIVSLLDALRRAVTGTPSARQAMSAIERGEVGNREGGATAGSRPRDMVVYHGSPHDFDIFDTGKIGTGEGNQTFGYGLYFTDRKSLAEHYRNALTRHSFEARYDGKKWGELRDTYNRSGEAWTDEQWDAMQALGAVEEQGDIDHALKRLSASQKSAAEWLERHRDRIIVRPRGRVYEVDIPEDGEYLLWDKPISAQPDKVKAALNKLNINIAQVSEDMFGENTEPAGSSLYYWLEGEQEGGFGSPQATSSALRQAGIAGIKYLNGRSRAQGEGDFNYVLFDDSQARVVGKFSRTAAEELFLSSDKSKMGEAIDKWRTRAQDRMLPLLRTQQRIEAQTAKGIPDQVNPYLQEELMSGRVGAEIEHYADDYVQPLFDAMKAEDVSVDELETYLYARHAPERNARISEINPEFEEGTGSGMSDAEAAGIMAQVEAEGKTETMERLAEKVDAMLRYAVDHRVESGLLSEEEADAWREQYQHYVPLRGQAELNPEEANDHPRFGSGINVRGKESRRAFGRKSKARDILAYAIMQGEEAIIRAGRNEVAKAFYALAKDSPDKDFWTVSKVTRKPVFNSGSGTVSYQNQTRIQPGDEPFTVTAKIDGQERRVTLNQKNPAAVRLAEAMRNMNGADLGSFMEVLSKFNRFLSTVNTTLNPEFVITNAFRDIQTAGANLQGVDVRGITRGTLKDYRKALVAATKGAFKKGDPDAKEWDKWYQEFRDEGGQVYFNRVEDLNEIRKRIEKQFSQMGSGKQAFMALKTAFGFIQNLNTGIENAVRLSAYKNARERGLSKAQAASLAKNLTVNFNRRGSWGPALNSLYLFYNASVQGSARMFTALKSPRVRKLAAAAVATGFALELMNMMLSGEDDDGESYYDKISEYDKAHNLIVMMPGSSRYLKIPLPYGYNVFYGIGRAGAEITEGKRWQDSAGNLASTAVDSFNPVGGADSLLNFIAPTIADPFVDLYGDNRDYADRPIYPEENPFEPPVPDSQRYFGSVAPHWKEISSLLNEGSGGDDVEPGLIDISPETLQYMQGQVFGAAGSFIDRTYGLGEKIVTGDDWAINDVPFARKIVGDKPTWYDKSAYYARIDEIETVADRAKKYEDADNYDRADAYEEKNSELLDLVPDMKDAQKDLRRIRKDRAQLELDEDNGTIDAATAKDERDALKDEEEAVISDFNTLYMQNVSKPKRP